jgi:hypothetical protein
VPNRPAIKAGFWNPICIKKDAVIAQDSCRKIILRALLAPHYSSTFGAAGLGQTGVCTNVHITLPDSDEEPTFVTPPCTHDLLTPDATPKRFRRENKIIERKLEASEILKEIDSDAYLAAEWTSSCLAAGSTIFFASFFFAASSTIFFASFPSPGLGRSGTPRVDCRSKEGSKGGHDGRTIPGSKTDPMA